MPMHPRLKMRRGRFGPGGFTGPVLKILSPANGSVFGPGSPGVVPNFVGQASDDLDGDISANIQWFVAGAGSPSAGIGSPEDVVATGASVDLSGRIVDVGSPGGPALYTVTARVADSGGNVRTASITVTVDS